MARQLRLLTPADWVPQQLLAARQRRRMRIQQLKPLVAVLQTEWSQCLAQIGRPMHRRLLILRQGPGSPSAARQLGDLRRTGPPRLLQPEAPRRSHNGGRGGRAHQLGDLWRTGFPRVRLPGAPRRSCTGGRGGRARGTRRRSGRAARRRRRTARTTQRCWRRRRCRARCLRGCCRSASCAAPEEPAGTAYELRSSKRQQQEVLSNVM